MTYWYTEQRGGTSRLLYRVKEATRIQTVHTVWFHLYKTFKNVPKSVLPESRSVFAEVWESGGDGRKKLQRGMKTLEGDEYSRLIY